MEKQSFDEIDIKDLVHKYTRKISDATNHTLERFGTNIRISGLISGILTYSNTTGISTRFFGTDLEDITQNDIEYIIEQVNIVIEKLELVKNEILGDELISNSLKTYFINKVVETLKILDLLKTAVYFEAEKGESSYTIPGESKEHMLAVLNKNMESVRGGKVIDRPVERESIKTFLSQLVSKNIKNISSEEKKFFEEKMQIESGEKSINQEKENVLQKTFLHQDEYVPLFKKLYQLSGKECVIIRKHKDVEGYWLDPITGVYVFNKNMKYEEILKILRDEGALLTGKEADDIGIISIEATNMITLGRTELNNMTYMKFPETFDYEYLSVERICELMDHEFNTHILTSSAALKGMKTGSANFVETQESKAIGNEKLVTKNIKELGVTLGATIHNISKYIAEQYDGETTLKLLFIYYKLIGNSDEEALGNAKKRTDRIKRYGPRDMPYASAKDNAYNAMTPDVLEFIRTKSIDEIEDVARKLYTGKRNAKTDLELIDDINEEIGANVEQMPLPIFVGKIMYHKLLNQEKGSLKKLSDGRRNEYDPRFKINKKRTKTELVIMGEIYDVLKKKVNQRKKLRA